MVKLDNLGDGLPFAIRTPALTDYLPSNGSHERRVNDDSNSQDDSIMAVSDISSAPDFSELARATLLLSNAIDRNSRRHSQSNSERDAWMIEQQVQIVAARSLHSIHRTQMHRWSCNINLW